MASAVHVNPRVLIIASNAAAVIDVRPVTTMWLFSIPTPASVIFAVPIMVGSIITPQENAHARSINTQIF